MAKEVEYKIGSVVGVGRNKTLARKDAEDKAAEILSGTYTPVYIFWRGTVACLTRDPFNGWNYRIIWPTEMMKPKVDKHGFERFYCTHGIGDRDEAIERAKFHLVQSMWTADDGPYLDIETKEFLDSDEQVHSLERWTAWQWKYKQAEVYGLDSFWCREWANQHRTYNTLQDFINHYQLQIEVANA